MKPQLEINRIPTIDLSEFLSSYRRAFLLVAACLFATALISFALVTFVFPSFHSKLLFKLSPSDTLLLESFPQTIPAFSSGFKQKLEEGPNPYQGIRSIRLNQNKFNMELLEITFSSGKKIENAELDSFIADIRKYRILFNKRREEVLNFPSHHRVISNNNLGLVTHENLQFMNAIKDKILTSLGPNDYKILADINSFGFLNQGTTGENIYYLIGYLKAKENMDGKVLESLEKNILQYHQNVEAVASFRQRMSTEGNQIYTFPDFGKYENSLSSLNQPDKLRKFIICALATFITFIIASLIILWRSQRPLLPLI